MSIVNQMLKDLDARRGPANGNQLAALQGLGLVPADRSHTQDFRKFVVWGCASFFSVLAVYQAIAWWHSDHQAADSQFVPVMSEPAAPAVPINTAHLRPAEQKTPEPVNVHPQLIDMLHSEAVTKELVPVTTLPLPLVATASATIEERPPVEPVKKLTGQQKADRFFADAQVALAEQDYARGETLLRQAMFEFPRHHAARAQLAALLTTRQNTDAAERLLSQGLQINGQQAELARPYAQLLVARGELEPSLAVLNTVVSGNYADSETFALRAAVLHRLGRHAAAARDYRSALTEQPRNAVWWAGLAIAEEHDQQFQSALAAYRRAAQLPMEDSLHNYVNQRIQIMQVTDGQ